MWARVRKNGTVKKVYFRPSWVKTKEAKHPPEIFRLWTPAELVAIRIYPVIPGQPVDHAISVEMGRDYLFDGTNVIETITSAPRQQTDIDREVKDKKYASDIQRLEKSDQRIANTVVDLITLLLAKNVISADDIALNIDKEVQKRKRLKRRIKKYEREQISIGN